MKKRLLILGFILFLLANAWLWIGIVEDPEFSEHRLIIKNEPSIYMFFRSPIGDSDMLIEDLSPELQEIELRYRKFVLDQ